MQRMRKPVTRWLGWVLIGLAFALYACGGGGGSGSGGEAGRVAVLLTDGPTDDFDQIWVTITGIELLSDQGKVSIFASGNGTDPKVVDLLAYRDEAALLTLASDVPARCYEKIRLTVTQVELVRLDELGEVAESYLANINARKIDLNPRGAFCVGPDETVLVQLDMDAEKCIHVIQRGHRDEYNFRPVVFVDILSQEVPGKLVRLEGVAAEVGENSFVLCPADSDWANGQQDGCPGPCVEVLVDGDTSVFGGDGSTIPVGPGELPLSDSLEADETVVAVGRFLMTPVPVDGDDAGICALPQFDAELVEISSNWQRWEGIVASAPADCDGTFDLQVLDGQGLDPDGNTVLPVHLFPETKVFSSAGEPLDCTDIEVGRRVMVDAALFLSNDIPDTLEAALVMVDVPPPADTLSGTLTEFTPDQLTVDTGEGPACAVLTTGAGTFEFVPGMSSDPDRFGPIVLSEAYEGEPVTLFGAFDPGSGCFATDLLVVGPLQPLL